MPTWQLRPVTQRRRAASRDAVEPLYRRALRSGMLRHPTPARSHRPRAPCDDGSDGHNVTRLDAFVSPVCPMAYVMCVYVARVSAAGKPAAAIAGVQRATMAPEECFAFSANAQRLGALPVLDDGDDAAVAGQSAHRLHRQCCALLDARIDRPRRYAASRRRHAPRSDGARRH